MLGDQRPDIRRQVDHLPPLDPGQRPARQVVAAARAPARLMRNNLIWEAGHLQRRARLALRPARLAPGLAPQ